MINLLNKKIKLILLLITFVLDIIFSLQITFGYRFLVDEVNNQGPAGFGSLYVLVLSPLYLIAFLSFSFIIIKVILSVWVYKQVKRSGESVVLAYESVERALFLSAIHLGACVFIWHQQFNILLNFIFEVITEQTTYAIIIIATLWFLLFYGIYRLLKKFYKSYIFWLLVGFLLMLFVWFVYRISITPPSAFVISPDGTKERIYYLPNGATSSTPY